MRSGDEPEAGTAAALAPFLRRTVGLGLALALALAATASADDRSAESGLPGARTTPGVVVASGLHFDLAAAWAQSTETLESAAPAIVQSEPEFAGATVDWDAMMRQRGTFFRASGLVVEQQNDGRLDSGEEIEFDTGGGFALAIGYRFVDTPLSVSAEYGYRSVDADGTRFDGDGDIRLHTITANVTFDATEIVGPVGVYAGVGLGARIDEFRFSNRSSEGSSTTEINGGGFYWQARGGLSVSMGNTVQLFGGVVWSDAGTLDEEELRVDAQMVAAEIGLRVFF